MSLPSIEYLKDQANRLVAYMGDKYRFRLRAASAFEAVAAMYRQPDWNTLQAMATRDSAESPKLPPSVLAEERAFPLTWQGGVPDLNVSGSDWFRHSLALGGRQLERRAWMLRHASEQLKRGWPGVFLNALGADVPPEARADFIEEGMLIELPEREPAFEPWEKRKPVAGMRVLNLMADMAPDEIASMLVSAGFDKKDMAPADDYYRQAANYVLTIAIHAMRAAAVNVSLKSLVELFADGSEGLARLYSKLDPTSEAARQLSVFLESITSKDGEVKAKTWASHFMVMVHALNNLDRNGWAHTLFSDTSEAQGLYSLLQEGKCILLEGPERSSGHAEKSVMFAMRSAMARRMMLPREERELGWVFGCGEVDQYFARMLTRMVEQGRSARIAVLMTAADASGVSEDVRANVWNELHLGGVNDALRAQLMAQMACRPVLVQPSRITVAG